MPIFRKLIDQVADAIAGHRGDEASGEERDAALRMATAVLMVDVARADYEFDVSEFHKLLKLIEKHFDLAPDAAAELVDAANEKAENLVSLHEFTQLLHRNLDESEKARIVSLLWQVAYADGRLDKFEDSLVLRIADLLYVNRGTVMRLKYDAARA